jgi:hypothetical protein
MVLDQLRDCKFLEECFVDVKASQVCQLRFLAYMVKINGVCSMQSVNLKLTEFVARVQYSGLKTGV